MEEIRTGIYRHFKGGLYHVHRIAYLEATKEPLVIYETLYDTEDFPKGTWWARPLSVFEENVKLDDGQVVKRFEFQNEHAT